VSKGPSRTGCRLGEAQLSRLQTELDAGPAVHDWVQDQRWTLPRITVLIGRLFHLRSTEPGVSYLPHRLGCSPQVPVHRAVQRDEAAIAACRHVVTGQTLARERGAWLCFHDEAGQSLRAPTARTWSRRGRTPVLAVCGRGSGRVSMAGPIATRPGLRTRLCYRLRVYHGRRTEVQGRREDDYLALLVAVHAQLRAPLILIRDDLHQQLSAPIRRFVAAHDWLTVVQLPSYAPEVNPTEGLWSQIERGIGNLAACSIDRLAAVVRSRLESIQYRPALLDGFITETGLVIQPQPP
jgi:Winged helix-turn helix/DDE superfamily endonuclease